MAPTTLTFTGELVVTSCWCGIRCAIPDQTDRQRKRAEAGWLIEHPEAFG